MTVLEAGGRVYVRPMTPEQAERTTLTVAGARKLTAQVRRHLTTTLDLVLEAWQVRVWETLDYPTFRAWRDAEVPELRLLRLPVDERRDVVAYWRRFGVSVRAIADGLNVSEGTVHSDLVFLRTSGELEQEDEGAQVISLDGRRRPARRAPADPVEGDPDAPELLDAELEGLTRKTDRTVVYVRRERERGMTYRELSALTGWHHGIASGTLTPLEQQGRLVMTTRQREGCVVYVHPDHVSDDGPVRVAYNPR